jgi:hypothetical protein
MWISLLFEIAQKGEQFSQSPMKEWIIAQSPQDTVFTPRRNFTIIGDFMAFVGSRDD